MSNEKVKSFRPFGLTWPLCLGFIVIIFAGVWTGSLTTDLAGGFALTLAMGIVFNEIGERIPFWNSYVGGRACPVVPGIGLFVYQPSDSRTICEIRFLLDE